MPDRFSVVVARERENRELKRANEILCKRRRFSLRRSSTADPMMVDFIQDHRGE